MGFYYSPDDTPAACLNVNAELTLVGDNRWEWTDGTDNRGMTKKLMTAGIIMKPGFEKIRINADSS